MSLPTAIICQRSSILCLVLVLASAPFAKAEDEKQVPFDQAVAILEALENRIQVLRWNVEVAQANLSNAEDPKSIKEWTAYSIKGSVLFDPQVQRHRAEFESVTSWHNGARPNAGSRDVIAFDGETYRRWFQSGLGDKVPASEAYRRGSISKSETLRGIDQGQFMEIWGPGPLGIGYMTPYFWTGLGPAEHLSKLLKRQAKTGKPTTIQAQKDGSWVIHTTVPFKSGKLCLVSIKYEPTKGAVTGAEWKSDDPKAAVWKTLDLTLQQVGKGFWVPSEASEVHKLTKPPKMTRITYTNIEINPPVTADSFRIEFPPGTELRDFINNKKYIVGYSDKDQANAVRGFMDRHGLGKPAAQAKRRWLLWLNIVAVIVISGILLFRWRRGGRSRFTATTGIIVFLLASCPTVLFAGEARAEGSASKGSETPHMSQCGVDVCCFAFEYFDVKYDVPRIKEGLNLTDNGASVQAVEDMLRAYGLQAETREGVTVRELERSLVGDNLAILPLKVAADDSLHFYVAMLATNRQPVIVDVLQSVRPLEKALTEKKFEKTKGLAIFVSRGSADEGAMSQMVDVTPNKIDLGSFSITGPEATVPKTASVSLHNHGRSPVMVSSVATSCGCAKAQWYGGIIRPDQDQKVTFSVTPALLGPGPIEKQGLLMFADNSTHVIKISGEGKSAQEIQKIGISPETFRIDLTDPQFAERDSLNVEAAVTGSADGVSKLSARSADSWLHPTMKPVKSGAATLVIEIKLDSPEVKQLGDKLMDLEGQVLLRTAKQSPEIPITITLIHKPLKVEPSFATLHRDSSDPAVFEISSGENSPKLSMELDEFDSNPKGLLLEPRRQQGDRLAVSVRATKESAPGLYVVKCSVHTPAKKRLSAKFVVNVVE